MENSIAKNRKKNWEINRVIRNIDHSSLTREENIRPISWLTDSLLKRKLV
jgi:hypothetical protein